MQQIDLLAIGDIVTEPFIKLIDAEATCDIDHENCKLCMRFGDKIPYENAEICRAVGNSANAAVSAARLGLSSTLLSYIGDDEIGRGNIEELKKNNVGTEYMKTIPNMASNYHYVLWYDVERTILVKHTEFPYQMDMSTPAPKWIYLSSMASNSENYHNQIADYLIANPSIMLAFQPGTFQMKLGVEKLKKIYERTEIFFCNVQEAEKILGAQNNHDKQALMQGLHALGPKKVIMTDGIDGAYGSDGTNFYFMPVYPHKPFERTGAGDAFASTFVSALIMGKSFEEAFTWAPINSMSVVQQVGAQKGLLSKEKLEEYLANAPADYKLKKLN